MIQDISMALDGLQGLAREIPENEAKFNDWNFIQYIDPVLVDDQDFDQLQSLNQALDQLYH